ncbi:MAG: tetratricopeptide repeat protein, partial [Candidatus Omnitrophota bacterium]|nr:tetratricopeptide repeat protein [Candidatus Omnitrophota bacterium]
MILLVVITSAAFLPSLKNGFVNWDDDVYVTENPLIKTLSWQNTRVIFTTFFRGGYYPLALLSYALEYRLFELNPFPYHLINLCLHLANSLLVFWLIFLLSKSAPISFITAVLFGIHPLHVESVAWVAERRDVLYALFFFGALISYLYYKKNKLAKFYYLSLFLFILSLFSKAMAVTLPLVLLLCDHLLEEKVNRRALAEKAPFFALAAIFALVTLIGARQFNDITAQGPSIVYQFFIAAHGLLFYLAKTLIPVQLSAYYPHPSIERAVNNLPWDYLISPVIVLLIVCLLIFKLRHNRKLIFGSLFFCVTILPVIRLLPSISAHPVNDRYSYVPLIGIFYLAAEGFAWLYKEKLKNSRGIRALLLSLLIAAICALSFLTARRCLAWRDGLSLWTDILRQYPDSITSTIGINLCNAYYRTGQYEKAIPLATRIVKLYPRIPYLYVNLGNAYSFLGKTEEGINWYKKAIVIDPNSEKEYFNLAFCYSRIGKKQEAIE